MFRALIVFAIVCLTVTAVRAEPCTARQLLSEIGIQYAQFHSGPHRQQREASLELDRLLPSGDVYQFSLQLSAEGYGVDPLRLGIAFTQIEQDIEAFRTGSPIEPLKTSMRAIFPLVPVETDCQSPLKDMPLLVSENRSSGVDGAQYKASKGDQSALAQHLQGGILSFVLMIAPSRLTLALITITSLITMTGFLCRHRIARIFRRRSRLSRRSVAMDFQVSMYGDSISVSSVDISIGGMKIALQSKMPHPLQVGDQLALHLPGQDVLATIVWSNKFYCGVAFQRRLRNRDFRKIIGEMLLQA